MAEDRFRAKRVRCEQARAIDAASAEALAAAHVSDRDKVERAIAAFVVVVSSPHYRKNEKLESMYEVLRNDPLHYCGSKFAGLLNAIRQSIYYTGQGMEKPEHLRKPLAEQLRRHNLKQWYAGVARYDEVAANRPLKPPGK